jgi:6-phosphogluconolactonase
LRKPGNPLFALTRRDFLKGASAFTILGSVTAALGANQPARKRYAYIGTSGPYSQGILVCEMDLQTGELSQIRLVSKTPNPSWLTLHPSQRYLYAANEVSDFGPERTGSVSAFAFDPASGDLQFLNTIGSGGASPAHCSVDRSGKFVLVANYGDGSIAVLPILANGSLGAATDVHHHTGSVGPEKATNAPPGSFAISGHDGPHAHMIDTDPNDRFVLQTDLGQDRIYIYSFDKAAGKLTPPSGSPYISLPPGDGPRHFVFHPNGRWLYSIQEESSTLVFFHYDPSSGTLSPQQTISALPPGFAGTSFSSEVLISSGGKFLYAGNRLHDSVAVFTIDSDGRLAYKGESSTLGDYPRQFNFEPTGKFLYACNSKSDNITCFKIDPRSGLLDFTGRYTAAGGASCIVFPA